MRAITSEVLLSFLCPFSLLCLCEAINIFLLCSPRMHFTSCSRDVELDYSQNLPWPSCNSAKWVCEMTLLFVLVHESCKWSWWTFLSFRLFLLFHFKCVCLFPLTEITFELWFLLKSSSWHKKSFFLATCPASHLDLLSQNFFSSVRMSVKRKNKKVTLQHQCTLEF